MNLQHKDFTGIWEDYQHLVNQIAEENWEKGVILIKEKLVGEGFLKKLGGLQRYNFGMEEFLEIIKNLDEVYLKGQDEEIKRKREGERQGKSFVLRKEIKVEDDDLELGGSED